MPGFRLGTGTRAARAAKGALAAGPFPILGAIRVLEDVVFPYRLGTEQLRTGPGWRNKLVGRISADPVDAIDQKPVRFLPMARDRESGKTAAAAHVRLVIDN